LSTDSIIALPHDSNRMHLSVIIFIVIALCAVVIGMVHSLKVSNIIKKKIDKLPLKAKYDLNRAFYMKHPVILCGFFFVLLSIGLWVIIKEGFVAVKCSPTQIILDYRMLSDVSYNWDDIKDVYLSRTGKFGRNIAIEIITNDGNSYRSVVRNRKREGEVFEQGYKKIVEFRNAIILNKKSSSVIFD
jgi:hypothetical protein